MSGTERYSINNYFWKKCLTASYAQQPAEYLALGTYSVLVEWYNILTFLSTHQVPGTELSTLSLSSHLVPTTTL